MGLHPVNLLHEKRWMAFAQGARPATSKSMAAATGEDRRTLAHWLREQVSRGLAKRVGRGLYDLADRVVIRF